MDDFMKTEAKDIISTAIEKASGATGINIEVSSPSHYHEPSPHTSRWLTHAIVCLQIREGLDGPSIRSLLALRHGGGLLLRDHTPGKDHPLHVLRRKDRRAPLQVLNTLLTYISIEGH